MGEILGLGITHYPALVARTAAPVSLRRLLADPGLPPRYRTPDGWPEIMRREWGDDRMVARVIDDGGGADANARLSGPP